MADYYHSQKKGINLEFFSRAAIKFSLLLSCISASAMPYSTKVPKGVDISPLLKIPADTQFPSLKVMQQFVAGSSKLHTSGENVLVIQSPYNAVGFKKSRNINIYQFASENEVKNKYVEYKNSHSEPEDKLYSETRAGEDTAAIYYKTARWDTSHGVPTKIYAIPEILVCVTKKNILIVISYIDRSNSSGYVREINEDIQYARSLLLKEATTSPSKQ